MARQYIVEHLQPSLLDERDLIFEVQCDHNHPDLVRVQFQSRHSTSKRYNTTIRFDSLSDPVILGWYCTCPTGPRKIGCCSHIAAVLWHLGVNRAQVPDPCSRSATHLLDYVEDSQEYYRYQGTNDSDDDDSDDNDNLDNNIRYMINDDNRDQAF